ncbi:Kinesin-like protein kif21b [Cichlidogyrus casuarinus]|uniref:Kinesin-like protein kif21b n=1 Tax=Cichlidogyrus casuarinus TaxID=1844966 RepID=A0ABD2Q350_9PLAT
MLQAANEDLRIKNKALAVKCQNLEARNAALSLDVQSSSLAQRFPESGDSARLEQMRAYALEVETLRSQLVEKEALVTAYQRALAKPMQTNYLDAALVEVSESSELDLPLKQKMKKRVKREATSLDEEEEDEEDTTESMASTDDSLSDEHETQVHEAIASVSATIDTKKEKLQVLEQKARTLETERNRLAVLIRDLTLRIKATEAERDAELAKAEQHSSDKVRAVKEFYEKKLKTMQKEIRSAYQARQDQQNRDRDNAKNEAEIRRLRQDLKELQKHKADLTKQLRQAKTAESKAAAELQETRRAKVLADTQLKRLKDSHTIAMQRKNEEIMRLRRDQTVKQSSISKPATPIGRSRSAMAIRVPNRSRAMPIFTSRPNTAFKRVKDKWQRINQDIDILVARKETLHSLQKDLETWLKERELVSRRLAHSKEALKTCPNHLLVTVQSDMASAEAQLKSTQEQIDECKESILDLESQLNLPSMPKRAEAVTNLVSVCARARMILPLVLTAINMHVRMTLSRLPLQTSSFSDIVNLADARALMSQLFSLIVEKSLEVHRLSKKAATMPVDDQPPASLDEDELDVMRGELMIDHT